jgi:DNA helicase IV
MIVGDLGQGIHSYRGIDSLDEVKEVFALNNHEPHYTELQISYRSTVEITNYCNQIIEPFSNYYKYRLSKPIGHRGTKVVAKSTQSEHLREIFIRNEISKLRGEGIQNIAILCRKHDKVYYLHKKLAIPYSTVFLALEREYTGSVIIAPVYLTKGLEFDAVFI